MLNLSECLKNIVGLSENDCACYGTDLPILGDLDGGDVLGDFPADPEAAPIEKPAEANVSLSGFYLDDPSFGIPLKFTGGTKDCGEGNVWDILTRSRTHGIRNMITAFTTLVTEKNINKLRKWVGPLGGTSHNYGVPNLGTIAGVYIAPIKHKGVRGLIDKIELYMQSAGTYDVNVYADSDLVTPINAAPIAITVANYFGRAVLETPLRLDFSDNHGRPVNYYVVYDRSGVDPRNVKFGCNCGNEKPWTSHIDIYGVNAATVAALETSARNTEYPNGLRIHMTMTCGFDWLCRSWDFEGGGWDRVFAECVWLFGVQELLNRQLNNPQPVTTMPKELVARKLEENDKILMPRMKWLADNVPLEESDCYVCNPLYEVQEILI